MGQLPPAMSRPRSSPQAEALRPPSRPPHPNSQRQNRPPHPNSQRQNRPPHPNSQPQSRPPHPNSQPQSRPPHPNSQPQSRRPRSRSRRWPRLPRLQRPRLQPVRRRWSHRPCPRRPQCCALRVTWPGHRPCPMSREPRWRSRPQRALVVNRPSRSHEVFLRPASHRFSNHPEAVTKSLRRVGLARRPGTWARSQPGAAATRRVSQRCHSGPGLPSSST
jgi:hypothetical protein